jgi:hypothetical protein
MATSGLIVAVKSFICVESRPMALRCDFDTRARHQSPPSQGAVVTEMAGKCLDNAGVAPSMSHGMDGHRIGTYLLCQ